jgi:hypothetical protein
MSAQFFHADISVKHYRYLRLDYPDISVFEKVKNLRHYNPTLTITFLHLVIRSTNFCLQHPELKVENSLDTFMKTALFLPVTWVKPPLTDRSITRSFGERKT